jgi:hypothetical protein
VWRSIAGVADAKSVYMAGKIMVTQMIMHYDFQVSNLANDLLEFNPPIIDG